MKALVVVDVQKQFNSHALYKDCMDYIEKNREKYDILIPMVYSHRLFGDINDKHEEDLNVDSCLYCNESDLEYETGNSAVIIRNTYASDYMLKDIPKDCEVDVIGCDDKSGVMANCMTLWDNNIDFRVLSDYVYTNNELGSDKIVEYMKQHFGKCVA